MLDTTAWWFIPWVLFLVVSGITLICGFWTLATWPKAPPFLFPPDCYPRYIHIETMPFSSGMIGSGAYFHLWENKFESWAKRI